MVQYAEPNADDMKFMQVAIDAAKEGMKVGGIPIGSCLVIDGEVVAKGCNQRVQQGNPVLHGEMDCIANAGRLKPQDYKKATLYTTLSPCDMCAGATILYGIPRVVLAENRTFMGAEEYLAQRGVELVNLDLHEAEQMLQEFIMHHPDLWHEDISV